MNDLDASLIPAREAAWGVRCAVEDRMTLGSAAILAMARTDVQQWMIGWAFDLQHQRYLNAWGAKNGYVPVWSGAVRGRSRIRHWEAT